MFNITQCSQAGGRASTVSLLGLFCSLQFYLQAHIINQIENSLNWSDLISVNYLIILSRKHNRLISLSVYCLGLGLQYKFWVIRKEVVYEQTF